MRYLILLTLTLIMTGCTVSRQAPDQVPDQRIYANAAKTRTQSAAVEIRRENRRSRCGMTVIIDREKAAELKPGEHVKLWLPSGQHQVIVHDFSRVCHYESGINTIDASRRYTVKLLLKAQNSFFRLQHFTE